MVGIIVLMFLPFAALFAVMGKLGAPEKRPARDEHEDGLLP
jgi:hypothetical protein